MSINQPGGQESFPIELQKHHYIQAEVEKGFLGIGRAKINSDQLLTDLVSLFSDIENPSEPIKILLDLGGVTSLNGKDVDHLGIALGMAWQTNGEVVLSGVSNEVRHYMDSKGWIQTKENNIGFKIVDLSAYNGGNKER